MPAAKWHKLTTLQQLPIAKPDICLEARLHSMPALGGSHWNIAMPFGMEKLEWCEKLLKTVYLF